MNTITKEQAIKNLSKVWIYGLFDGFGRVLYIGQTTSKDRRPVSQIKRLSDFLPRGAYCAIIKSVSGETKADAEECRLIRYFKKRRQAKLNRRVTHARPPRGGMASIKWEEQGLVFTSTMEVSRAFPSVSPSRIWQILKKANGQPVKHPHFENVTLKQLISA